jgi:acetyl esterase/lipase
MMKTIDLVDPELRAFLAQIPLPTMDMDRLMERRATPLPVPEATPNPDLAVSEHMVPGTNGHPDARLLLYRPTKATGSLPAILHIHGGGYVIGKPEMDDLNNRNYATELSCIVASIDYRLAPEAPFPAPLEDCYAALAWLHRNADALGVDRARIAIKGESAGGGLAAGLALLARDRGEVAVCFQCLTAPMIDDRTAAGDPHPYAGEFVWNAESNRFGWACYLGRDPGGDDVSPYAAPARAEDFAGLPATFICVSDLDLFLEENLDYARHLSRAGVPVELHVYPGAYHGFRMAGDTALLRRYLNDCRAALAGALAPAA